MLSSINAPLFHTISCFFHLTVFSDAVTVHIRNAEWNQHFSTEWFVIRMVSSPLVISTVPSEKSARFQALKTRKRLEQTPNR